MEHYLYILPIKQSFIPSYTTATHTVPTSPCWECLKRPSWCKIGFSWNILALADLIAFTIISA